MKFQRIFGLFALDGESSWASRWLVRCFSAACIFGMAPLLAFSPQSANADCSCQSKPALKSAYNKSSIVLVGRVLEQRKTPLKPGFNEIKITILRKFKNSDEEVGRESIVLYTPDSDESCGVTFQPGFEYLIFAVGNPAFYTTTSCDRTEVLENAQVDLHRLMQLTNNG